MKKLLLLAIALLLTISIASGCQSNKGETTSASADGLPKDANGNKIMTMKVFTNDASAPTRVTNFESAAEKLNEELEKEKADYRVKIEPIVKPMSAEDFDKNFIFASQSNNAADIYTTSYASVGWMAEGDYILPLDSVKKEKVFENIMDGYWQPVTWDGKAYGVIQDTEARVVYFNKEILRKMGWSEEDINQLPKKAEAGEFTLNDMTDTAADARKQGFVKNGYEFDRGPNDVPMNFYNFGAELYDWKNKKFVLDKEKALKTFEWVKESRESGVVPAQNMTTDKAEKLARMLNQETLFAQGGIWDEAKFRTQGWHKELGNVTTDWIKQNVGVMNLPVVKKGQKPITVSNPYVYVVSKNSKNPDIAKRLLAHVSAPELQAKHAVETSHIPFTKEGQEHEQVKANEWINSVNYLTNYSKFTGNHPDQTKYSKILIDATSYVMSGEMTPEKAVGYIEEQMALNLKANSVIK
ncbi:sugar ABC transporter substrate-binding protein [Bacillus sp. T33-2]|uniref:sugar ABC transporter substrate-binding protein n=1 Tax=Bacillus sp. T33-2 TaxID=2054168 RepID=UPI000C763373|nr:extracellular solute-binding protein [Bacillus sp. T33-2]PLR95790.1 ABC transporter substrate-binding protein [Bacillus sp. T33-2]